MPPPTTHRTARLEARITPASLDLVRRAAEIQGCSLSDFVVAAAQEAANRIITETQIVRLSVEDQRSIADAILNPPPPTPALERAIKRHRVTDGGLRFPTSWAGTIGRWTSALRAILTAATKSAGAENPHDLQTNSSRERRFAFSQWSHFEHVREVLRGSTKTCGTPAIIALYVTNARSCA